VHKIKVLKSHPESN